MPRIATIPSPLRTSPFRASTAVAAGLLTTNALHGTAWRRLLYDVYINAAAYDPDNHRMWCDAVALTIRKGGCIGGWSAAFLRGVNILPREAKVWINVPLEVRVRPRNRVHTRRTPLPETDVELLDHTPITTSVRTAFDLGRYLPRTEALIALDALCRQLVKVDELESYATERWPWPGTRQLRELLPLIEPLTESPMETRLRLLLFDADAATPVAQYVVWAPDGSFIARVDLAYDELKIAIEYEGDHHRDSRQFQYDVARHNALEDAGWLVLRFTAADVFRHPERLVRRVFNAIHSRR